MYLTCGIYFPNENLQSNPALIWPKADKHLCHIIRKIKEKQQELNIQVTRTFQFGCPQCSRGTKKERLLVEQEDITRYVCIQKDKLTLLDYYEPNSPYRSVAGNWFRCPTCDPIPFDPRILWWTCSNAIRTCSNLHVSVLLQ